MKNRMKNSMLLLALMAGNHVNCIHSDTPAEKAYDKYEAFNQSPAYKAYKQAIEAYKQAIASAKKAYDKAIASAEEAIAAFSSCAATASSADAIAVS